MFDVAINTTSYDETICKTADIIAKTIWLYAQDKYTDSDIDSVQEIVNVDCQYVMNIKY